MKTTFFQVHVIFWFYIYLVLFKVVKLPTCAFCLLVQFLLLAIVKMTFCVCYLNSYKTTQDDNGLDRKPASKSSIESMYFVVVIIISVFFEEKVSFYGGGNLVKQHTLYSYQISARNKIWITFIILLMSRALLIDISCWSITLFRHIIIKKLSSWFSFKFLAQFSWGINRCLIIDKNQLDP